MTTTLHSAVVSQLSKRQQNSLYALKNKVDNAHSSYATVRVSNAQHAAMQAAYNAVKVSGEEIPPHIAAAAAKLGLK